MLGSFLSTFKMILEMVFESLLWFFLIISVSWNRNISQNLKCLCNFDSSSTPIKKVEKKLVHVHLRLIHVEV